MNWQQNFNAAMDAISKILNVKFSGSEADQIMALQSMKPISEQIEASGKEVQGLQTRIEAIEKSLQGKVFFTEERLNEIVTQLSSDKLNEMQTAFAKMKADFSAEFADAKIAIVQAGTVVAGDGTTPTSAETNQQKIEGQEKEVVKKVIFSREVTFERNK